MEVFGLGAPARSKHPFRSRARDPACPRIDERCGAGSEETVRTRLYQRIARLDAAIGERVLP
jgi:hypothetical protein